jgi:hypothetical protein
VSWLIISLSEKTEKLSFLQNSYLEIELQKFNQTFSTGAMDTSKIRVKRINGTKERGLYGPWIARGPIDDSYKVKATMYRKQGGEYRLLPYNFPLADYCTALNSDPYVLPDMAKHSNFSLPISCPMSNVRRTSIEGFEKPSKSQHEIS